MYQDWMENTPIFGEIKNVYIGEETNSKIKNKIILVICMQKVGQADALLGKDYYNMGCDWRSCDIFTADDLIYKYKKKWWQFQKKIRNRGKR